MLELFKIDDSKMPLRLGSALRVPSYAYPNWGILLGAYRIESDTAYTIEWQGGSPKQMDYVIEALSEAGVGNNSQILRDSCARVVAARVRNLTKHDRVKKIHYMDVGAGVSTVNAFDAIDDKYKDNVFITLVEPSKKRVEFAAEELTKRGLARNKDFRLVVAPDQHMLAFVEPESQDIISYVASIHHHSYLDTPIKTAAAVMKKKGTLIISDWYNPEWEHPRRVYEALRDDFDADEFNWTTKDRDLAAFASAYPKALKEAPELSPLNRASYMQIRRFWKGWARVRKRAIETGEFDENDDILMLEAHRPVERQNEIIKSAGLVINPKYMEDQEGNNVVRDNPNQLLDDSRLLMTTVAYKQ